MKKPDRSQVIGIAPAGPGHQVVTIKSEREGNRTYRRKPCSDCPWRKDAKIGEFPVEAYRHSARTAYDMAQETFACHQSGTDKPATCAGFLLRGAAHNLSVRLGLMEGKIDLGEVGDDGIELYDNYRDMAIANGVDPDDERLKPCRE